MINTEDERLPSILWMCGEPESCRVPRGMRQRGEVQLCKFDRAGLVAATATECVLVADLASCSEPIQPQIELLEKFALRPICLIEGAQGAAISKYLNSGHVRRILFAPISEQELRAALSETAMSNGVGTGHVREMRGLVQALGDFFALASPIAFGKAQRIAHYAARLAEELEFADTWGVCTAAMLSQIGLVAVAPDLAAKVCRNETLTADEEREMAFVAVIAEEITQGIVLLDDVRRLIRGAFGSESGSVVAAVDTQLLRLAKAFEESGEIQRLEGRIHAEIDSQGYWPPLAAAARRLVESEQSPRRKEISFSDIESGMVLAEDLYDGTRLLLARGHLLQARGIRRLQAMTSYRLMDRRVQVLVQDQLR